jgi:hypothetical protein
MTDTNTNTIEVSKISLKTRDLVERASVSRDALISNLKVRYATCDTQSEVDNDILARRIALSLKAIHDATKGAKRVDAAEYDQAALIIIGKKTWTKTAIVDDNLRSQDEQNIYHAADVWLLRARKEAGIETLNKQGGARTPRVPKGETLVNAIVAETTPVGATTPTSFAINVPKPKNGSDLATAIMALATAATKLLNDASQTKALDGELGLLARNALASMIEAGRTFDAHRNAHELAQAANSPDAPKGASRAAVIALKKAHDKGAARAAVIALKEAHDKRAPVVEILN